MTEGQLRQRNKKYSSLMEACQALGLRLTRQRRAIIELLDSSEGHMDARRLLEEAKRRVPDIDKTTVYRTIRRLQKLGLIDELDLLHFQHEGHYYETLPEKMHLHIVCLACGKVMEMRPKALVTLENEVEIENDFRVELARIEIGGRCSACRGKNPPIQRPE